MKMTTASAPVMSGIARSAYVIAPMSDSPRGPSDQVSVEASMTRAQAKWGFGGEEMLR